MGRTGTFICIDIVLEQVKKENKVDIAGTINKLRHQRMKMVQTPVRLRMRIQMISYSKTNIFPPKCHSKISILKLILPTYFFIKEQYIFIHDAILESVMCGDTEINATNLRSTLMKMNKKNKKDNLMKLETQFKV